MIDHDLLIKVAADVQNICKKVDKIEAKVDAQARQCISVQEKKNTKYVQKSIWMWITGALFIFAASAFIYTHEVDQHIHTHSENAQIHKAIE